MARPARGNVEIVSRKDGLRTFWLRLTVNGGRERVRLGTDRDGWTPARAQVELEEQIKTIQAGTWAPPEQAAPSDDNDPTFRTYASSWLEDNMLEWRPRTITDVKWRLESHLLPLIGEDRLSTFDIPRVTTVKTSLLKESRRIAERRDAGIIDRDARNMALRPLSNESINKCLALLARILDDAVERGYLRDNPARRVKRLRYHRSRRPILERHEVRAMLEAADRLDRRAAGLTDEVLQVAELRRQGLTYPTIAARLSIATSTACYRQSRYEQAGDPIPFVRVWVRLLWAAGLRIDEACGVRRCDVDLIRKRLSVGQAKTDAGVRHVQLTPDTLADLRRYIELTPGVPAKAPLLPTRRGTRQDRNNPAKRSVRPLIAETNIVLAERGQPSLPDGVTAHALRKTYFTFLHEAGAPPRWVADQGGHVDPSTSLRIYTESLRHRERSEHGEAFDRLLSDDSHDEMGGRRKPAA